MSTTATHPYRAELLQFAHEQLDADARAAVEQHLRRCAACRAFVESTPPPMPTPDAARAAAELDDVVELEPIEHTSATLVQPRVDVAAAPGSDDIARRVRRLRIVAGILAVMVILLLVATAWYVSSDNWNASNESANADDTSVPITDLRSV